MALTQTYYTCNTNDGNYEENIIYVEYCSHTENERN